MKKNYVSLEMEFVIFENEEIVTASVGTDYLPGEENVDGSDIFGF